MAASAPVTLAPPSQAEREIIRRVVDPAPPLRPALVAELRALMGRTS